MIIPDSLTPLPVVPATSEEGQPSTDLGFDDFVLESTVRQILVGPLNVPSGERRPLTAQDGFAGRQEFSSPFISLATETLHDQEPAKPFCPSGPHPAMSRPRRATPPAPRILREQAYPHQPVSDRLWVMGMGIALVGIIVSGALIEYSGSQPDPVAAPVLGSPAQIGSPAELHLQPSMASANPDAAMP